MDYITIIKYATLAFPVVAFLFLLPFILIEYHKYGSISFFKSVIIYVFIYYLICAYFLVILPLPKIRDVAKMTGPYMQLQPFKFVSDFINKSSFVLTDIHTYKLALSENYFYVPIFNIFLTIPFGMFLRYFFKLDFKKTILGTFLLSLFFELTQLSGLYFIYPRPYRLFDIDDLILNTFGGIVGFLLCSPLKCFLPSIDLVREDARNKGKMVSGFRRTVAFFLDLSIVLLIIICGKFIFSNNKIWIYEVILLYYLVIPFILHSSTLGEKFLNLQVVDNNDKENFKRLLFRRLLWFLFYIFLPSGVFFAVIHLGNKYFWGLYGFLLIAILIISYLISMLKYVFSSKTMFYEKLSKTKMISTIK